MNARERFLATMRYEPRDRPFLHEMGASESAIERWAKEGLHPDVSYRLLAGQDHMQKLHCVNVYLSPWVEEHQMLVEKGSYGMVDEQGYEVWTDEDLGMFLKVPGALAPRTVQWIAYGLRTREDWEKTYRPMLDPDDPRRFPAGWPHVAKLLALRDYPLGAPLGSLYGKLRNWMGLEGMSYALHDDPAWVEEMADVLSWCIARTLERLLRECPCDYGAMFEDMAYKTSSLVDPRMYCKIFYKYYRRILDVARRFGLDIVLVDSDGRLDQLIPVWLDWGINAVQPVERAAGNDPVELRQRFGKGLRMLGGVDKRMLARGDRSEMKAEIERLTPLVEEGGYCPGIDHGIPPDIGWESYLHYRALLADLLADLCLL